LRLEEATSAAQQTNAADVRSLGARLSAERDAIEHLLLRELQHVETEGTISIQGLQAELAQTDCSGKEERMARDDEIWKCGKKIDELDTALESERFEHEYDLLFYGGSLASLTGEIAHMEEELEGQRRQLDADKQALGKQLALEGADKSNRVRDYQRQLQETKQAAAEMAEAYESKLSIVQGEHRKAKEELQGRLGALQSDKARSENELTAALHSLAAEKESEERKLLTQIKRLEQVKEQEKAVLRGRVDRLSKLQETALNAGGSAKARAILYYESMKSRNMPTGTLSWRGEEEGPNEGEGLPGPREDDTGSIYAGLRAASPVDGRLDPQLYSAIPG